jgi:hypothetical protein
MTAVSDIPEAPTTRFARWRKYLPFLLLGPVSGPLIAAIVFNFRAGRRVVASLYAVALISFTILLPYVTAKLGLRLL